MRSVTESTSKSSQAKTRPRRPMFWFAASLLLAACSLPGCRNSTADAQRQAKLALTSSSFTAGMIPKEFTCDGAGTSPQLAWSAPPAGTRSFTLIVTDPDAPGGTFVHWVLYDMPPATRQLTEGQSSRDQLGDGSHQGRNSFDQIGYGAPCPPGKTTHHYVFTLYALDRKLNLPAAATRTEVESALQGHVLARGELIGIYPW